MITPADSEVLRLAREWVCVEEALLAHWKTRNGDSNEASDEWRERERDCSRWVRTAQIAIYSAAMVAYGEIER